MSFIIIIYNYLFFNYNKQFFLNDNLVVMLVQVKLQPLGQCGIEPSHLHRATNTLRKNISTIFREITTPRLEPETLRME